MADYDFEAPSFSLGLDFDLQSEPQHTPAKRPSDTANLRTIGEDDDDFESPARISHPPPTLKRLRRGSTARPAYEGRKPESEGPQCNVDDEIEDFSSDEDCPRGGLPSSSVCGSSKPSLHGKNAVTIESGSQWKSRKGKEVSNASASGDVETKGSNVMFPKLTVSPLRLFQLIDSDSDDPSVIEDTSKEMPHVNLSSKDKQSVSSKNACLSNQATKKPSIGRPEGRDLWNDFCTKKSSRIPTPAFDEVFEEYFTNVNNKGKPEIDCNGTSNGGKLDETSLPPAHCYFFHMDSRIQKLVRERLPYFFPLGAENNLEYQKNVSDIDYMGQFGHENNSRKADVMKNIEKSSTRSKKSTKNSKAGSISQDSENWVTPKSCAGLPKVAGSRRVQAVSNSAGHWFMGPDGRRVYVNKNGQELTGQIAYRHYRKESGKGYKGSKKKTATKKKTAAKKSGPKK
ncbi:hypothetical protein ACS0TY_032739 [Phlomoides rotata]